MGFFTNNKNIYIYILFFRKIDWKEGSYIPKFMPSVVIGMSLTMAKSLVNREARPRWNEPDSSTNFVAFMRRGAVEYDHRGAD